MEHEVLGAQVEVVPVWEQIPGIERRCCRRKMKDGVVQPSVLQAQRTESIRCFEDGDKTDETLKAVTERNDERVNCKQWSMRYSNSNPK